MNKYGIDSFYSNNVWFCWSLVNRFTTYFTLLRCNSFFLQYKNYLWKYDNNNKHISLILPSLPDWSILYWFAIKRTISGKSTIQITNIQRSGQRLPFYFFFIIYTNLKIWFLKYNTSLYIFYPIICNLFCKKPS